MVGLLGGMPGTPVFRLNMLSVVCVRLAVQEESPKGRGKAEGFCAGSGRLLGGQILEEKDGRKQKAVSVLVSSPVIPLIVPLVSACFVPISPAGSH